MNEPQLYDLYSASNYPISLAKEANIKNYGMSFYIAYLLYKQGIPSNQALKMMGLNTKVAREEFAQLKKQLDKMISCT